MKRVKLRRLRALASRALRATRHGVSKGRGPGTTTVPSNVQATFLSPSSEVAAAGSVPGGTTILQAARHLKVDLDHFCGGHASCGTCRVEVVDGEQSLSGMGGMEEMTLGASGIAKNQRLACQAVMLGPATVRIPRWF